MDKFSHFTGDVLGLMNENIFRFSQLFWFEKKVSRVYVFTEQALTSEYTGGAVLYNTPL